MKEQRRLLVFAPSARSGGPLQYLREAIPRLVEAWDGPCWLAAPAESLPSPDTLPPTVTLAPLQTSGKGHGRPLRVLDRHRLARSLWAEFEPDIAFCLGGYTYYGRRRPNVVLFQNAVRPRDLRHPTLPTVVYVAGLRLLMAIAQVRATKAIAVSHFVGSTLPLRRARGVAAVVHHGVAAASSSWSTGGTNDDILIPGAILPYKGLETAIDAIAESPGAGHLVVRGPVLDNRYLGYLRTLIERRGVADRVVFAGNTTRDELMRELAAARAILIPSRAEACPNVMLEAAAVNPSRPIVAVEHRWNEEYAALLDARPPRQRLGEALSSLPAMSTPDVQARRTAALSTHHSWPGAVAKTVEVLRGAFA